MLLLIEWKGTTRAARTTNETRDAEVGGESLISHWFYKGLQLTVRFCSCRQGPNGIDSGLAEVSLKKTKEIQRFPWNAKGGFLDAHAGINSRPASSGGNLPISIGFIRICG